MARRDINGKLIFDFTLPDLTHIGDRIKGKTKTVKKEKFNETIKKRKEDQKTINLMIEGITLIIKRSGKEAVTRKQIREELREYMWHRDWPYNVVQFSRALKRMIKTKKAEKVYSLGKAYIHHKEQYRLK